MRTVKSVLTNFKIKTFQSGIVLTYTQQPTATKLAANYCLTRMWCHQQTCLPRERTHPSVLNMEIYRVGFFQETFFAEH